MPDDEQRLLREFLGGIRRRAEAHEVTLNPGREMAEEGRESIPISICRNGGDQAAEFPGLRVILGRRALHRSQPRWGKGSDEATG